MARSWRQAGRRHLVVASFVIVFVVASAGFGVTEAGHVAVMQADSITVTVESVSVDDSPEPTIEVRLRFENPTPRRLDVSTVRQLVVSRDSAVIVRSTTPGLDPWPISIPSGKQATVTATIGLENPVPDPGTDGPYSVRGVFGGRIGDVTVEIPVEEGVS